VRLGVQATWNSCTASTVLPTALCTSSAPRLPSGSALAFLPAISKFPGLAEQTVGVCLAAKVVRKRFQKREHNMDARLKVRQRNVLPQKVAKHALRSARIDIILISVSYPRCTERGDIAHNIGARKWPSEATTGSDRQCSLREV
jgi:hypothetical protein